jgi:hypothetical protein
MYMRDVSSFEELEQVMLNLHDCPFDLDRAMFDAVAQTWTGIFLRPDWEDPRAEHKGLPLIYTSTRLPVVEGTLTLHGVTDQFLNDEEGINTYGFDELERQANGVRLRYHEHLYIDLTLAGAIAGTYEERPLPGLVAIYREYFLLQSGPDIQRVSESDSRITDLGNRSSER